MSDRDEQGVANALQMKMAKLRKKIGQDLALELDAFDESALRGRIVQCEINVYESEKAKEADDDLTGMKLAAKEAGLPYADVKKMQKAIATYCSCLLDGKNLT